MTQEPVIRRNHNIPIGYLFWIFGFMGAHRFYYGRPKTGTLWFFTFGLLGIGWLVDLFLIPEMDRESDIRYASDLKSGPKDYQAAWMLLVFLGPWGLHRIYLGKWVSGLIYFFTFGLCGFGYLYDLWTLNEQVSETNSQLLTQRQV